MIQRYEFRLFERYRDLFGEMIPPSLRLSYGILTLRGRIGDPVFRRLARIEAELHEAALEGIFAGWKIKVSYTESELERAELFLLQLPITHISAEDHGTKYTESAECSQEVSELEVLDGSGSNFQIAKRIVPCGLCSRQAGLLCVPVRKLPKSRSICRLFGGELVVSSQFASLVNSGGFSGGELCPTSAGASRLQLVVLSHALEVSPETRFGAHPFDNKSQGYFRCRSGEIAGNSLISPLRIVKDSWDGADLCRTRVHVSSRQGAYRPYQLLVVSSRLFRAMRNAGLRGFHYEIAELV